MDEIIDYLNIIHSSIITKPNNTNESIVKQNK
mgnify:FL=1